MEFDQILFKKIITFYEKIVKKKSPEVLGRTVQLIDISSRLTLIARALTGENIEIMPAEQEGGWKNNIFYLPTTFSLFPELHDNLRFYIFRTVYLSIQFEEKLNWSEDYKIPAIEVARLKAAESSIRILEIMKREYPPIFAYFDSIQPHLENEALANYWLFGKFMAAEAIFDHADRKDYDKNSQSKESNNPTTEIKSKPVEEAEVTNVDKKAQEDYVLTHNFEKVETADEFNGIWRGFDGDDSLQEDADALSELNLKHMVRTDEVAHSVYQAEFRNLTNIADSVDSATNTVCLTYPEWNYQMKDYKHDYCKVFIKDIKGGDPEYARQCLSDNKKTLTELRRIFAQINQERKIIRRMPEGDEIDIDAIVDWYADLQSGSPPSENIYLTSRKKESDIAILFLMDLSLSTDSYADGNRVLDVEKQAVILFGEVLTEYGVEFSIGGFYSKTRNNCSYMPIKGFRENWTKAKQKLSQIQPEGYTRIGPALRHSKAVIEKHSARHKWVILLSDGKPNDYDKYEGKYGVADVKQALREMHANHINTYAVAIESIARYYLPQMFGQNHYNILSHPDMLIQSLALLYKRIQNI
ncbi:MAG: VWA domain-containing protein [Bacteroidetes bacterium]|nr:VWA domain-containing protein [Bacteroidota bacterium]